MDHPPSTTSSSRPARRALLTSAAALSAVAAPVVLVAATFGGSTGELAAAQEIASRDAIHAQAASPAVRFDSATAAVADLGSQALQDPAGTAQAPVAPTTTVPAPTTTAPPPTTVPPPPPALAYGDPNDPVTWDRLAQCEAGGNWYINTGNGYYGGLQFSARTWRGVGGTGLPHQNSREVQIEMGKRLQARAGWSQWPACTRKLGYR